MREPSCSVIVPTHRRPEALRRCVEAVAAQEYPRSRLELVVVDDGGHEDLHGVLAAAEGRVELTLIRRSRRGPGAARNAGAAVAGGRLLAFTDDDCRPEPGWVAALAAGWGEPFAGVGGRTVNGLARNPCASLSQLVISAGYARNNRDPGDARFFASNNLAVAADLFHDVGGFDERFRTSEDRDLCDRLVVSGGRLAYAERAVVRHFHDLTLAGFWEQHREYGRGARAYHEAFAARHGGSRVRLEPDFYAGLAARAWRERRSVADGVRSELLLGVWAAANAVGYARGGTAPPQRPAAPERVAAART